MATSSALDLLAYGDTREILFPCLLRDIGEIVIENDFGFVDAARNNEIGVHHAVVDVDHEVRIDPVIVGARSRFAPRAVFASPLSVAMGLDCRQKRSPVSIV